MTTLPARVFVARDVQRGSSRALAARCLALYAGRHGLPDARLAPGDRPVTREGTLHLSVTHSGGLWACAAHTAPVGLDAEALRPGRPFEALARRWFTPDEQALVARQPGLFYPVWCAKEAWVKLTGEGIARGFRRVSVAGADGLTPRLEGFALAQPVLAEGYAACLWHSGPAVELEALEAESQAQLK